VLADAYRRSISNGAALRIARVSRVVLERAAALRAAQASLKLPDAIHAATALLAGCTTFLSNDARFESVAGLPVLLLSKLP
jgi:predicted nucleic acid-binding protein